jgi:hypothetical protein
MASDPSKADTGGQVPLRWVFVGMVVAALALALAGPRIRQWPPIAQWYATAWCAAFVVLAGGFIWLKLAARRRHITEGGRLLLAVHSPPSRWLLGVECALLLWTIVTAYFTDLAIRGGDGRVIYNGLFVIIFSAAWQGLLVHSIILAPFEFRERGAVLKNRGLVRWEDLQCRRGQSPGELCFQGPWWLGNVHVAPDQRELVEKLLAERGAVISEVA